MSDLPTASLHTWDELEIELAELCMSSLVPFNEAILELVRNHDSASADALLLAAISFCAGFDQMIGTDGMELLLGSQQRYITVAALAADIAVIPPGIRTCGGLLAHWNETNDRMFIHVGREAPAGTAL